MKKILFVSGLDFKEKSIQVIRKTPEAYQRAGWDVHYLVGRDTSRNGDYFYEKIINPSNITIYRFSVPLSFLDSAWNNPIWKALIFRIRNIFLITILAYKSIRLLAKHQFSVLYGYELYGVLALRVLRFFGIAKRIRFVIRFQGVYAGQWKRKGQWFRNLINWLYFLGLKTKADLCVMTNDGTMGDKLLDSLGNRTPRLFFVNGVNSFELDTLKLEEIKEIFPKDKIHFISVCRLVPQKRVDRSIALITKLVNDVEANNILYSIIGSGAEVDNLKRVVSENGLNNSIRFLGSVKNEEVKYYLACADYFLSMDRISNVGNPLLEAIRANKLIVTINNGDTGSWIKHKWNGLIYELSSEELLEEDYQKMVADICQLMGNSDEFMRLKENLKVTEAKKLWTWDERMKSEIQSVEELLN